MGAPHVEQHHQSAAAPRTDHQLRALIEQSAAGIAQTDLDGRLLFANRRFAQILGYAPDELVGRTVQDLTHPDDRPDTARAVAHGAATGHEYALEKRYVRKDGSTVWVSVSASIVKDDDGRPQSIMGVVVDVSDRKAAEHARREVESRLQLAVDALGLGLWDVNLADWTVAESDRFVAMLGLPPHTRHVSITEWARYVHPDDAPRARAKFEGALAGTCEYEDEQRLIGADGVTRWVHVKGTVVRDAAGKPLRMVGVCSDITDRRRAQEDSVRATAAAEASLARWRAVVANMAEGVVVADAHGNMLEWNRAALDMHGFTSMDEVRANLTQIAPIFEITTPDGAAVPMDDWPLPRLMRGESFTNTELRIRRLDRPLDLIISYSGAPVRDRDGHLTLVVLTLHDVTAERRYQQELRESESRFREMFDQTPIGMTVNALDGRYLHANPAYQRLVGYAPDELLDPAFDLTRLTHPDDRPRMAELQRQLLAGRIPAFFLEKRYVRKDGSTIWVRVTGTARRDAAGRPIQFIRLVEDIDDRKRAEAQREHLLDRERAARADAERASRMKDEFLATLSHELRTPLNAVLGWSRILLGTAPPATELAQGLEIIVRNARAQAQIIEDLLDMSRIISGKLRLDVHPTPLAPIVQSAVETVRPAADARGVHLGATLTDLAATVSADPNRLQQVFWNLLTNAVKFTPRGGHVQVTLARAAAAASHVEVTVADTGEGIRPEFLPFVFDRFRQADASTTRRHGGLGLGLAIVKQLVELHGGTVRAASPGPGQGATFTVTLPLAAPAAPEPVAPIPPTPGAASPTTTPTSAAAPAPEQGLPDLPEVTARIAGLRALVVDDEPDARALVRRLLESANATVTTAASAAEALDLLRQHPFDVLLSDIGMPGEDGYALIRRVRALPNDRGGTTPAVALTAYARAEDRLNALLAGFQHHVPKPVDPTELLATVAAVARRNATPLP